MDKKEIESRREFFKSAARRVLPVVGMLAFGKVMMAGETHERHNAMDCNNGCDGACWGGCGGDCRASCSGSCDGDCYGDCRSTCSGSCDGYCAGTCSDTCANSTS